MEFKDLLRIVENEPLFETGFLLSGDVDALDIRKQLSRWTAAGKLTQWRRGLYSLAAPYQKTVPHPFIIANRLVAGSTISLQSALAYYGMIPERVVTTTSVSTRRPVTYATPLGQFDFRHIQVNLFHTYRRQDLGHNQWAYIATPEKALLDLVYLQPGGDSIDYLRSLRLQALDQLDLDLLKQLAITAQKAKIIRAVNVFCRLVDEEKSGYAPL